MSRTLQGPGAGDVVEQPIEELSALRDVQPPAALVARVMTRLAEPRPAVDVALAAAPVRDRDQAVAARDHLPRRWGWARCSCSSARR